MRQLQSRQAQQPAGRPKAPALQRLRLDQERPEAAAPQAVKAGSPRRGSGGRKLLEAVAGAASGAALFLAFPPADFGPIAFVALIPLYLVWSRGGVAGAARSGAAFGLVFFGGLLYWIKLFGVPAYIALVGLQSVWILFGLILAGFAARRVPSLRGPLFVFGWISGEFLRSKFPFGGFTWGGAGYSQHDALHLLRITAFTGVWGLSAIVCAVNVLISGVLTRVFARKRPVEWRPLAMRIAAVAALLLVPLVLPSGTAEGNEARIAMVQGNAPEPAGDPHVDDFEVLEGHIAATEQIKGQVDLVVWPESSFDRDPFQNPDFGGPLTEIVLETRAPFLVGSNSEAFEGREVRRRNVSLFIRSNATLAGTYVKRHLVPFGEWVPFRSVLSPVFKELEQVPYDLVPGEKPGVFTIPPGNFASVICFESTFPDLVRTSVNAGARFLVVSTNNISYARTAASDQHVAFSQVRAAEHHMWVAHTALTGISAVVAPDGRVTQKTGLFERSLLTPTIRFAESQTFYASAGDWVPVGALAGLVSILLLGSVMTQTRTELDPLVEDEDQRVLVVVPTYDEADNIEGLLEQLLSLPGELHVLVVDDGSPDGTAAIVERVRLTNDRVHLMQRPAKMGLGRAYISGFRWGLDQGFTRLIEMDADFSHSPADVPRLVAASRFADLVIGSRYVKGGGVEGWSKARHLLSRAGNLYARILLGFRVKDSTSGFRCYRAEALSILPLHEVKSDGYAFQIDMAYRLWRAGHRVDEIPITFKERAVGVSKMSNAIVREAMMLVTRWGLARLFGGGGGRQRGSWE
ncbi:MAG TPA: apolipoprotein N-acyltransferase [Actinomycetota bacterium]|nr:apolipoprotein N-acyltransferase [Actinomycetota bacterium]